MAALGGLILLVGSVVAILLVAGLIGNQSGGAGIADALVLPPPRTDAQASLATGPQVGKLAPDFEVSAFDGSRHRLSDFRGKTVYINFWGSWCTPCLLELPDVQALQERHPDELAVIAVNRRDPLGRAQDYLKKLPRPDGGKGVSFTINAMDPDDTLYREYDGLGMPVSFFIDANGVVTRLYNGIISLATMEEAVAEAAAGVPSSGS